MKMALPVVSLMLMFKSVPNMVAVSLLTLRACTTFIAWYVSVHSH
jgi:hypothetical protein